MTAPDYQKIKNLPIDYQESVIEEIRTRRRKEKKAELETKLAGLDKDKDLWDYLTTERHLRELDDDYGPGFKFTNDVDFTDDQNEKLKQLQGDRDKQLAETTKNLKRLPMRLIRQGFRFGFGFSYGIIAKESPELADTYVMVDFIDFKNLYNLYKDALKDDENKTPWSKVEIKKVDADKIDNYWPLEIDGKWFVPQITQVEWKKPPSGSMPTEKYVDQLLRYPCGESQNILRCLLPYAEQLYCYRPTTYMQLQSKFSHFPEYSYKKISLW